MNKVLGHGQLGKVQQRQSVKDAGNVQRLALHMHLHSMVVLPTEVMLSRGLVNCVL